MTDDFEVGMGCTALVGIALLTCGGILAAGGMTIETCTMGGGDSLRSGYLVLILYLIGGMCVAVSTIPRYAMLLLVPAAGLALWHSVFAIQLAYGYWIHGYSACTIMMGMTDQVGPGEWMDGSESGLAILWLSLSALFWFVVIRAGLSSASR